MTTWPLTRTVGVLGVDEDWDERLETERAWSRVIAFTIWWRHGRESRIDLTRPGTQCMQAVYLASNSGGTLRTFWRGCPWTGHSVLARPKRQGAAPCRFVQRPVVFPQRPVVFSAPCRFFSALSFSESPLVSSGFYQRYFELEVAESVQLKRKVARFSCITLLFASDIAAILDLRHRFRHESEATLMAFEGMSFSQLFTWKVGAGIYEY